ncbi:MAG: inositol monophosphatase family protein [Acidimicrobiales bacterium]|nr:inositol monophosphatase family protein [Acidimicrobiales bacterium]
MAAPEHDDLRLLAIEIATDAAQFVAYEREQADWSHTSDTKSTPTDMVTAVDRASEARIVAAIRKRRPDDGLMGEEGTGAPGTTGLTWVIDPIDGTTNFVYGYPATAVSIAVVQDVSGDSVAGAVVDVGRGEVFSATKGGGAFVNDGPIALGDGPVDLSFALVSTGFSYSAETRVAQGKLIARLLPVIRDIRRGGSAALDLCWAAAGRVDAYFERGTAPWDRAAGMLVAQEAGLLGDFEDPLVWVAHPRIAPDLLALIR